MYKTRLFVILILSVLLCVSADVPEEDDGQNDYLKDFANEFKTTIVEPQHLTCENYESYCEAAGATDFGDARTCKIWSKNYLCNNGTDINSLRKAIYEMEAAASMNDS